MLSTFEKLISIFAAGTVVVQTPTKLPQIIYVEDKVSTVNFQPIKELGIQNLSLSYFGFSGAIPDQARIDWNKSLDKLWDQKLRIKNVSPATVNAVPDILKEFSVADSDTMTIEAHIESLDNTLTDVKSNMNWAGICTKYRLSNTQCYNFVLSSYNIDARMLTAYSMTELMPYREGERNYELMSIYMENSGRRYLDVIPALGDKYLSMGRYQFTSFAIGSDKNGPRSANQIANFSPKYPIPGSVVKLNGMQSDLAAYYFSVYNVLTLIKKMNETGNKRFARNCVNQKDQIVEYIATAHHNPSWARKRAIQWITNDCSKPLINYQGKRLEIYSIKTSTNYEAILQKT